MSLLSSSIGNVHCLTDEEADHNMLQGMITSEVMFCEGGIYTELMMSTGCPINGRLRVEMTVKHGKILLFPFYTELTNNHKELLDLKDIL